MKKTEGNFKKLKVFIKMFHSYVRKEHFNILLYTKLSLKSTCILKLHRSEAK